MRMEDDFMRKLVSALAASLLVGMLLVACGEASQTPSTGTTATVAPASTTAASTTTAAAATTAASTSGSGVGTTTAAATTAVAKQNLTLSLLASQGWIKEPEQA